MLFGYRTKKLIDIEEEPKLAALPIKNENELYRITEISNMLEIDEKILIVTQSKMRLIGLPFTYYVIYATDRRMIIRDISLHGLSDKTTRIPYSIITDVNCKDGLFSSCIKLRMSQTLGGNELPVLDRYGVTENEIDCIIEHIPKEKAHELVKIVREMINKQELMAEENQTLTGVNEHIFASLPSKDSPADELLKIARLKSEGVINEQEFIQLKQSIMDRIH